LNASLYTVIKATDEENKCASRGRTEIVPFPKTYRVNPPRIGLLKNITEKKSIVQIIWITRLKETKLRTNETLFVKNPIANKRGTTLQIQKKELVLANKSR